MTDDSEKDDVTIASVDATLRAIQYLQTDAARLKGPVTEADLAAIWAEKYTPEEQRAFARRFLTDVFKRPDASRSNTGTAGDDPTSPTTDVA